MSCINSEVQCQLAEIDSLEILVIVDNELDPITQCYNPAVNMNGGLKEVLTNSPYELGGGRGMGHELRMDSICCSAHGLSLMITATKGDTKHTLLFDTGPEEEAWERNVKRLGADIKQVEGIHLSHWHRDHSGGMLRAIKMINQAKPKPNPGVIVDLHPARPDYRGIMAKEIVSLEADPTFSEIEEAGAKVSKNASAHTILDDVFLISGEIPRKTEYELGLKRGVRFMSEKGTWEEDTLILDERLVMCNLKDKGLVVFTGCSHAGVVNTARYAVELGGGTPLYCVMGGYHLADAELPHIEQTVADLKNLEPKVLIPGHCSGWRVKFKIEQEMPGCLVPSFVGSKFTLR